VGVLGLSQNYTKPDDEEKKTTPLGLAQQYIDLPTDSVNPPGAEVSNPSLMPDVPSVDLETPLVPPQAMSFASVADEEALKRQELRSAEFGAQPNTNEMPSVFNPAVPEMPPVQDMTPQQIEEFRLNQIMKTGGPTVEKAELNLNPSVSGISGVPGNYTLNLPLGATPISDEDAAKIIARANEFQMPNNAFVRGIGRLEGVVNILGQQLGLKSVPNFIEKAQELDRIFPDAPKEVRDGLEAITKEDNTWGEMFQAMIDNPGAVLSVTGESLPLMLPGLIAATGVSVATANPLAGAAVIGASSGAVEFGAVLDEEITNSGVDKNDDAAMLALMSDGEFWAKARERAVRRGVPIALFDALSMGIAGKAANFVRVRGGGRAAITGTTVGVELPLQSGAGGAGEVFAQLAEIQGGFRDQINKGEVGLESAGEVVPGLGEAAIGMATTPIDTTQREIRRGLKELDAAEFETSAQQQAIANLATPQTNVEQPVTPPVGGSLPITPTDTTQTVETPSAPSGLEQPSAPLPPTDIPEQPQPVQAGTEVPTEPEAPAQDQPPTAPTATVNSRDDITSGLDELNQEAFADSVAEEVYMIPRGQGMAAFDEQEEVFTRKDAESRKRQKEILKNLDEAIIDNDKFGGEEYAPLSTALRQYSTYLKDLRKNAKPSKPKAAAAPEQPTIPEPPKPTQVASEQPAQPEVPTQDTPPIAQEPPVAPTVPDQPASLPNPQEAEAVGTDVDNVVKTVQTPDGQKNYNVKGKVIELADLKQAQGELQPRDRSRKESDALAKERAGSMFNPARLLDDPTSGSGAPIIARDGTVMSGNGRVLTMQEVYANQPESLARYRTALEEAGINTEGFTQPVFVRQLSDDMTMAELREFADLSNTEAQAQMSMTERASRDATRLTDSGIIDLYRGDFEIDAAQNREFVTEYAKKILSPTEQGAFVDSNGVISQEGISRVRNAILASAFDNPDTLATMLESSDENIKAISNAFMAAAPKFAQLKKQIADGRTEAQFDITPQLADMANLISRLRRDGVKLQDYYNQSDMLSQPDPAVQQLVRAFYNEGLTRANSTKAMKDFLTFYADEALQKETGGLIPDDTTASDIIEAGRQRTEDKRNAAKGQDQGGLEFAASNNVERADAGRKQVQKPRNERSSQRTAETSPETESQVNDARSESEVEPSVEGVAELRDTESVTPDRAETREENTRGTRSGRVTIAQSETLRQSLYRDAFTDAGFDADTAVNLPITRQYKIISDLVAKKFGLRYIEKPKQGVGYDQVNALLDAYHNLQWMTHTLNLPTQAIGLDNTLGLALPQRAWGGYLAAYVNKTATTPSNYQSDINPVTGPVILMPGRSNSFAHEWGHALDYHILDRIGADWGRGVTGRIRKNLEKGELVYAENAPVNVVEAMGDLMNAMFLDNAEVSAEIMKLEGEVARLEAKQAKSGKPIKKLAEMQQQLRRLREGSSRKKIARSQYRIDAEKFATDNNSDASYWTRPTEMFARAFEAYVSRNVEAAGGRTEFIAYEDEAYKLTLDKVQGGDDRLALTYPNDPDRMRIYHAMDRLMEALRTEIIQQGTPAQAPGDLDMIDAQAEFYKAVDLDKKERMSLWSDQKRAWNEHKAMRLKIKGRPKRFASDWAMFQDTAGVVLINTKRGILFNLAERYKGNPKAKKLIESVIARVATDPGSTDNRVTVSGGTFEEAVRNASRRYAGVWAQLLEKHQLNSFTASENEQLRLFLTSDETTQLRAPDKIKRAAGDIRNRLLNPMYDYMRKNGLNVNYLPDGGYMPRMMDALLVIDDKQKFKYGLPGQKNRGAKALYTDVIYENEYGEVNPSDAEQARALINLSRRKGIEPLLEEETVETARTLSNLLFSIDRLSKSLDDPEVDVDAVEAEIQKLQEEAETLHAELYEDLRDPYGESAAEDWFERVTRRQVGDISRHGVQGSFAKSRKLPPEADTYMVDFYLDPVEALTNYISGVTRKVEFEKRFGTSNVPEGKRKRTTGNSIDPASDVHDFMSYVSEEMASAGMKEHEVRQIQQIVEVVTGTGARGDFALETVLNTLNTFGTMALLPRAVISSIAEPMTTAVTTGKVTDGFRSFAYALDDFATFVRGRSARERKQYYKQLGSILGVIDLPESGEVIANRVGGTATEDSKNAARLGRFFVRTGLVALTNAQRRGSMRVGIRYLSQLGDQYINPASPRMKERARELLQDFGVQAADMDQFAEFMLNLEKNDKGLYDVDSIVQKSGELTDMGEILAIAAQRFTDMSIQDPKIIDRPMYAETPVGRIVFGIQSFIAAFQRNVLIGTMKRVQREYEKGGVVSGTAYATINAALPLASLFMTHTIVSAVREMLLNADKWEEEKEADNLEMYLLTLGLSRSGFIGRMDPLVNAMTSLKYQSDLSNMMVGASGAYYLKAAQRIAGAWPDSLGGFNSPNTVASEYQAARGAYDIIVPTALSMLATYPGLGTVGAYGAGALAAVGTSPTAKHWVLRNVIHELYGVEYRPGRPGGRSSSGTLVAR
jgi:uncharacterized small protein (DUF1192 family)